MRSDEAHDSSLDFRDERQVLGILDSSNDNVWAPVLLPYAFASTQ